MTALSRTPFLDDLAGQVFHPGDPGYDEAVSGFNVAVVHGPALVVAAADAADVSAAVGHARATGLAVAVQCTGHGARQAVGSDTLLLRTAAMDSVTVDPVSRTATVGAGATAAQVVAASAPHGLAPVTGAAPSVGAVGLTVGGGIGPLARSIGFAADRVRSFEVVTADGEQRHVDAGSEPDLFFALRGGGGGVAVVTSMTVELLELSDVWGGAVFFPGADAAAVLHAWRTWAPSLPAEVTTSIGLLRLPPLPTLPDPLRGQFLVHLRVASTGSPDEASSALDAMLEVATPVMNTVGVMPYTALGAVHMDPPEPAPAFDRGCVLREFTAEAADSLLAVVGPDADTPLLLAEVRHLGGAMAVEPAVANAVSGRDAQWALYTVGILAPEVAASVPTAAAGVIDAMTPWRAGVQYNFACGDRLETAWTPAVLERLRQITRDRDPENLLRPAQPVPS